MAAKASGGSGRRCGGQVRAKARRRRPRVQGEGRCPKKPDFVVAVMAAKPCRGSARRCGGRATIPRGMMWLFILAFCPVFVLLYLARRWEPEAPDMRVSTTWGRIRRSFLSLRMWQRLLFVAWIVAWALLFFVTTPMISNIAIVILGYAGAGWAAWSAWRRRRAARPSP